MLVGGCLLLKGVVAVAAKTATLRCGRRRTAATSVGG